MQKYIISVSDESPGTNIIRAVGRRKLDYKIVTPQNEELLFYSRYRLCANRLQLESAANSAYIRNKFTKMYDDWDIVLHGLGTNNNDVSKIINYTQVVRPGVIVTTKDNCWKNLLDGFFMATIMDYFIICNYPKYLHNIQVYAAQLKMDDPSNITGNIEANFYVDHNFTSNSDMLVELSNSTIIYV